MGDCGGDDGGFMALVGIDTELAIFEQEMSCPTCSHRAVRWILVVK